MIFRTSHRCEKVRQAKQASCQNSPTIVLQLCSFFLFFCLKNLISFYELARVSENGIGGGFPFRIQTFGEGKPSFEETPDQPPSGVWGFLIL